jgi:organic radical activating enzyme
VVIRWFFMSLILTVTRACNLRCSYCPTAKDGWPSLSVDQALLGLRLYAARGGGDVKLFGGEPLLVPEVVEAVMDEAEATPEIRRVYLSTNGLGLNRAWLARVARSEKSILTISLDGAPEDNRRFRRTLHDDVPDAYDHIMSLREHILRTPRVVITQTIPPASASRAAQNFEHLLSLGFRRFNLLPGYYIPWRPEQLMALRRGFQRDRRAYPRDLGGAAATSTCATSTPGRRRRSLTPASWSTPTAPSTPPTSASPQSSTICAPRRRWAPWTTRRAPRPSPRRPSS